MISRNLSSAGETYGSANSRRAGWADRGATVTSCWGTAAGVSATTNGEAGTNNGVAADRSGRASSCTRGESGVGGTGVGANRVASRSGTDSGVSGTVSGTYDCVGVQGRRRGARGDVSGHKTAVKVDIAGRARRSEHDRGRRWLPGAPFPPRPPCVPFQSSARARAARTDDMHARHHAAGVARRAKPPPCARRMGRGKAVDHRTARQRRDLRYALPHGFCTRVAQPRPRESHCTKKPGRPGRD